MLIKYPNESQYIYNMTLPPSSGGFNRTLYRVKHWFEYGRTFETNRPEVNRLEPFHSYNMDEEKQWYWYRLLAWSRYGYYLLNNEEANYIVNAFQGVTHPARAFTNKSWDGINYITGEQGNGGMNTADTIVCGGNILSGIPMEVNGRKYLQVETLNAENVFPSLDEVNPKTHPWLFNWATWIMKTSLPDGGLKVTNFPQLDYVAPVYVPLASNHSRGKMLFPFGGTDYTDHWVSYLEELQPNTPIPPAVNIWRAE